jgi:hypothetical protein
MKCTHPSDTGHPSILAGAVGEALAEVLTGEEQQSWQSVAPVVPLGGRSRFVWPCRPAGAGRDGHDP